MNTPPRTEASLTTRAQAWFRDIPLSTRFTLCLCVLLSAVALLTGFDLAQMACISGPLIVEDVQLYRLLTASVVHSGVLHLAFNMFAFVPMAASMERQLGSVQLAYVLLLFTLLGDAFFILAAYAADWVLGIGRAGCAVGLSGVVFALIVVDTRLSGAQQRSIFGFFAVPAAYFPWALLVLWQLLLPHVSFFGHLGGIVAGQLYSRGWLQRISPPASAFQAAERAFPLRLFVHLDAFILHAGGPSLPTSVTATEGGPLGFPVVRPTWLGRGLRSWLPVATADRDEARPPPSDSHPASDARAKGHLLGGAAVPPGVPNRAAAAAAEARATKGGGPPPSATGATGAKSMSEPP